MGGGLDVGLFAVVRNVMEVVSDYMRKVTEVVFYQVLRL